MSLPAVLEMLCCIVDRLSPVLLKPRQSAKRKWGYEIEPVIQQKSKANEQAIVGALQRVLRASKGRRRRWRSNGRPIQDEMWLVPAAFNGFPLPDLAARKLHLV